MRHNLQVGSLLDLTAVAVFSAGYWVDAAGLIALGIILFAAGLGFCLARFRCPCCHRYVGIIGYRPGRFCSRCGALLEDPEDDERP